MKSQPSDDEVVCIKTKKSNDQQSRSHHHNIKNMFSKKTGTVTEKLSTLKSVHAINGEIINFKQKLVDDAIGYKSEHSDQISLKQRAKTNNKMLDFLLLKPMQIQCKFIKDKQNNVVTMSFKCPPTGIMWIPEGEDEKGDDCD